MQKCFAAIAGTGAWVPETILTNRTLETMLDTTGAWILERTGIEERRILQQDGKGVSFMAIHAVKNLLENTRTKADEIDVLIFTTVNPDYKFPNAASLVCHGAGLTNAFGFDVNATCSGFIYALEIGRRFIESGAYKNVVIVSSEKMSATTDYTDRSSAILFGDGAAAVLLEPSEKYGIQDVLLKTDGIGADMIIAPHGGSAVPITRQSLEDGMQYFRQDGRSVFKHAVVGMEAACKQVMERNHIKKQDISYVFAHQANLRIIESIAKRLDISMDKFPVNIEKYGNTSSASIPLCLHDFAHKIKPGDKILFTAFGSGYVWGAVYLTWEY